jgi:endonuclease/exonuclease/phosphatase family metal-dependent hydrolase
MRLDPSSNRMPLQARAATAPQAVEAPRPSAAPSRAESLLSGVGSFFKGAGTMVRHFFKPDGTWTNPDVKTPPDKGGLTVMTYNVMVKTTRFDQVAQELKKHDADVVCLQETSEDTAVRLGKQLGYHVAWQEHPLHSYGGVAVLSKYPIESAENIAMDNPLGDRVHEFWNSLKNKKPHMAAMDSRHMIHATLKVGDRTVDVLDGHLTLFGAETNARQVEQMASMAKAMEAKGHTVVVTGDWNTNFALAREGAADAKGTFETPTDTVSEFKDRTGFTPGNNGNARDKAAMNRLLDQMNYFWDTESRSVLVDGQLTTPEQALAELKSGTVDPKSDRHRKLMLAADGATVLGADKRFDNIFASKDAQFVSAHIDQTTTASDHQPVIAELKWK